MGLHLNLRAQLNHPQLKAARPLRGKGGGGKETFSSLVSFEAARADPEAERTGFLPPMRTNGDGEREGTRGKRKPKKTP